MRSQILTLLSVCVNTRFVRSVELYVSTFADTDVLTLNFTVVPGCCAAGNPEPPNREVVPPKGLEVVLVDPNSPPLLVLVPKPGGHDNNLSNQYDNYTQQHPAES